MRKVRVLFSVAAVLATMAMTPGVTYASTGDTAPERTASVKYVEAASLADCPPGYLCLWEHINYGGFMVGWESGLYTSDFRNIPCPSNACNGVTFDDDAGSGYNRSGRIYCVSDGYSGGGADNTMPVGWSGNFTSDWDDRASSLSLAGCP